MRMMRNLILAACVVTGLAAGPLMAQVKNFTPVTEQTLLNPSPDDWLMPSRTYDWQRFSPLKQITTQNVGKLQMSWTRGLPNAIYQEMTPIVHNGVMYIFIGPGTIQALDATNGNLLWEYNRKLPEDIKVGRARNIALYGDSIFFDAADGYVVALDAKTGAQRWQTLGHDPKSGGQISSGPVVVGGKVVTGRICRGTRDACYISAYDAESGKELWKVWTTAAKGDPGGDSWGDFPDDKRTSAPWGLSGSYDPVRHLVYWGTGNPPGTRMSRHNGDPDGEPRFAPSALYSNCTLAIDVNTGKLVWYYQYTPGDDWNSDDAHERVLFRTSVNPDPSAVKWISSKLTKGQQRDVMVTDGETGGLFMNDRATGEFLWATPFPFDTPEFHLSKVDVDTGKTYLNWDVVAKKPGDKHIMCFQDQKGYWGMSYFPSKNAMYIPYENMCGEEITNAQGRATENVIMRPGTDPNVFSGIAKVDMTTGKTTQFFTQKDPSVGAVLATAGNLIFWGDMNRRLRAFDADSGKVLWETIVGGIVQNSTITYSVNGKQYVAVMTGDGVGHTAERLHIIPETTPREQNAVYVFALPGQK